MATQDSLAQQEKPKPVTVDGIPPEIWKRVRIAALEENTTVGSIVTGALCTLFGLSQNEYGQSE